METLHTATLTVTMETLLTVTMKPVITVTYYYCSPSVLKSLRMCVWTCYLAVRLSRQEVMYWL